MVFILLHEGIHVSAITLLKVAANHRCKKVIVWVSTKLLEAVQFLSTEIQTMLSFHRYSKLQHVLLKSALYMIEPSKLSIL